MRSLLLDIETFPVEIYAWGVYQVNAVGIKKQPEVCCYSAKWLGVEQFTRALPDFRKSNNDRYLISDIWKLLNEADVVIAHNGDKFDLRRLNSRFVKWGLLPPAPYHTIDTLKISRRIFGFPSNRLDDLCEYLGIGKKINTGGFDLWRGCMSNDSLSWEHMKRYNEHDVELLEGLYYRLLPWITNHPNQSEGISCPKCGSTNLQSRGLAHTITRDYKRYQCTDCGGWARGTKSAGTRLITNV